MNITFKSMTKLNKCVLHRGVELVKFSTCPGTSKKPKSGVSLTFLASGYQVEAGGCFDSIRLLTLYKFIKSSRGNMPE